MYNQRYFENTKTKKINKKKLIHRNKNKNKSHIR